MGLIASVFSFTGASLSRNVLDAPKSKIAQASLFFLVIVIVGSKIAPAYPNWEEETVSGGILASEVGYRECG